MRKLLTYICCLSVIFSLFVLPAQAVAMESEVPFEEVGYELLPLSDEGTTLSVGGSSIPDVPPTNPPFYGSCYVTGTTNTGNTVTLYFPINYQTGYFGVDSNGYLISVYSSSISGYYSGGYNNSISLSAFDYPRYRSSSSSYDYSYLYLIPTASNIDIATESAGRFSVDDILPYVTILLLGVILVCFMKRW